jgi:FMN phosphatase YigB (HAD superfamily)
VGDSYDDDVRGATAIGLRAVWLRGNVEVAPATDGSAVSTISHLTEIENLLRD